MAVDELGVTIHEKVRSLVGKEAGLAILGPGGRVLWASMHEDELSLAREVVRCFSGLWDRGDYYVSASDDGRLVVIKATREIYLALLAKAREGIILLALRSIISSFSRALSEAGAGIEAVEEEMDVWPLVMLEPRSGRELKVIPYDAILSLSEALGLRVIRLDERVVALIRAVDGKTVADIARELGMDMGEACCLVADLVEAGVLRAQVKEMVRPEFNAVFSLAPGVRPEAIISSGLEEIAQVIVANLDRGYSVLELSWGLRGLGFETRPGDVLKILEDLVEKGLAKKIS